WVLLLTLISAIMTFTDLGHRYAPQSFWKPSKIGESFTVDFGKVYPVDRLNMYEGPGGRGKTIVESSVDGQNWVPYIEVEHKTNRVFTWKLEDKTVDARYMRFTVQATGYSLYEAAFWTKGVTVPVPVMDLTMNGTAGSDTVGTGWNVFDEQDK